MDEWIVELSMKMNRGSNDEIESENIYETENRRWIWIMAVLMKMNRKAFEKCEYCIYGIDANES